MITHNFADLFFNIRENVYFRIEVRFCQGLSTQYDYRIRFVFWRIEMNADVLVPIDYIRT